MGEGISGTHRARHVSSLSGSAEPNVSSIREVVPDRNTNGMKTFLEFLIPQLGVDRGESDQMDSQVISRKHAASPKRSALNYRYRAELRAVNVTGILVFMYQVRSVR